MKSDITPAPRFRRLLAALLDMALAGGRTWVWRRSEGGKAGMSRWAPMSGAAGGFLREQLGSPGQHLLDLRTVDRRTGRRVELWRSGVLLATAAGGQLLIRRLTASAEKPERARERQRFRHELRALNERYPLGSRERNSELSALMERHPGPIDAWRPMALPLAVGLITTGLRRRLAPTTQVLARSR